MTGFRKRAALALLELGYTLVHAALTVPTQPVAEEAPIPLPEDWELTPDYFDTPPLVFRGSKILLEGVPYKVLSFHFLQDGSVDLIDVKALPK